MDEAPVMFLWIFSAVIGVGCRVTLLYYHLTPRLQKSFLHSSSLVPLLSVSASSCPNLFMFFSLLSLVYLYPVPKVAPVKMTMRWARLVPEE